MPVLRIRKHIFIDFDDRPNKIYWTKLSNYILDKYGIGPFAAIDISSNIINDSFDFFIDEFKAILKKESSLSFYCYVYELMENGIELWQEMIGGQPLEKIEETDFATHQRSLRLILEQATELKIKTDKITQAYMPVLIRKVEELIYLGYWIYGFGGILSEIKMIGNCYKIDFDDKNIIGFERRQPYNSLFDQIAPEILSSYSEGIFDESAFNDLKNAIKECLDIDYGSSINMALELKKQFCKYHTNYCTYPFHLLPQNYNHFFNVDYEVAEAFYSGLTLTSRNKLSLKDSVLKAHSLDRYFYRPFLELNIDNEDKVLIGLAKVTESIVSLSINAINWNKAPSEWLKNKKFRDFIRSKADAHDKILEDHIENVLIENKIPYDRNIKSFKVLKGNQKRIDIANVGEMDFIYLDSIKKQIIVADSKYHIARYDMMAYRVDYSNFVREYEPKLENKINFLRNNKNLVEEHFQVITGIYIDLSEYEVDGLFLVNTPVMYNYIGKYRAYHLPIFKSLLKDDYKPTVYVFSYKNKQFAIEEPYFKNACEAAND